MDPLHDFHDMTACSQQGPSLQEEDSLPTQKRDKDSLLEQSPSPPKPEPGSPTKNLLSSSPVPFLPPPRAPISSPQRAQNSVKPALLVINEEATEGTSLGTKQFSQFSTIADAAPPNTDWADWDSAAAFSSGSEPTKPAGLPRGISLFDPVCESATTIASTDSCGLHTSKGSAIMGDSSGANPVESALCVNDDQTSNA